MFKVDNKNTRRTSHLCQGLSFNKFAFLKAATLLEKRVWHRCDVVLVFFLLTLNIFHTCFYCFYCWLWITKSSLVIIYSSFIFHNMVEADLSPCVIWNWLAYLGVIYFREMFLHVCQARSSRCLRQKQLPEVFCKKGVL